MVIRFFIAMVKHGFQRIGLTPINVVDFSIGNLLHHPENFENMSLDATYSLLLI